jgi:methyl-accepting chemotaxis protein
MLRKLVPSVVRRRYAARLLVLLVLTLGIIGAVGYVTLTGVQDDVADVEDRTASIENRTQAVERQAASVETEVERSTENQLTSTAEIQADAIGNWMAKLQTLTETVSGAQEVTDGSAADRRFYFSQEGNTLSNDIEEIYYYDIENETVLQGTGDVSVDGDPITAEKFSGGLSSRVQAIDWSEVSGVNVIESIYSSGGVDPKQVMLFAARVDDAEDRAVLIEARIGNRIEALYDAESGQGTSIVTLSGETVIRGRNNASADLSVERTLLERAATTGNSTYATDANYAYGYAAVSFDGDDVIQQRETPKLVAVTTVPTEEAFALRNTVTDALGDVNSALGDANAALGDASSALSGTQTALLTILAVALLALGGFGAVIGYQTIRPLSKLRDRAERMEEGDLDVELETKREDEIGRLYGSFAAMRDSLRERIRESTEAREEAEKSRERVVALNEDLERKADHYSDVMQDCAGGDLTRRMDPESDNDSMTEIGEAFNEMVEDIESTVVQVQGFATQVATESEEVTASAEEVRAASQNVTESIQQISDGADEQDETLQSVSGEMSGLSTTVEEIASLSNEVADISERTAETGRRGSEAAKEAIEGMNQIEAESRRAVEQIERLDEEMDRIDELIEFVTDVANRTNRLALNANIEASRATEGGGDGGFGAVANEIKELAAETKDATEDMEESIDRVQVQAEAAVESVTTTGELIDENTESIRSAIEALDEIAEYAEETNTGVQEISAATEQQAASTQEVVAMVDEAATIAERTSLASENVAAAAEQQTSAMTEVSGSASDLSQRAAELSEVLDRFATTEPDATAGDGG